MEPTNGSVGEVSVSSRQPLPAAQQQCALGSLGVRAGQIDELVGQLHTSILEAIEPTAACSCVGDDDTRP